MARNASRTTETADPTTHDHSWERVKERFRVGQIVQGVVKNVQVYGVFFDIGASFPAFMDVLEAHAQPMDVGQEMSLKIVQFADWNKQIRVAPATPPHPASESSN
jgi:ribosomal protein S1